DSALLLLVERIGRDLMTDDVVIRDIDRLAITRRGETNLVGDPALTVVSLLDRAVVQTLHAHHGIPRIAMDRVLVAVEPGVKSLAVPVHAELIVRALVGVRERSRVRILECVGLPGA